MRLVYYINEYKEQIIDMNFVSVKNILEKNCSKYLKETKGNWFYRNIISSNVESDKLGYRKIRKNRKPLGTDLDAFKWFNKWLQSNGHVRRDQSISVTSDIGHQLLLPESTFLIFVEGNYDYTWIKTKDINVRSENWDNFTIENIYNLNNKKENFKPTMLLIKIKVNNKYNEKGLDDREKIMYKETKKFYKNEFPKFFTTNKGIQTAYKKGYEIWFKAKGYYFVHYNDYLSEYLKMML